MSRLPKHSEHHLVGRIGWMRAAVLGANDGIISTASLIVGVASAAATQSDVLIAGVAGLVAGAMSMAVASTDLWAAAASVHSPAASRFSPVR